MAEIELSTIAEKLLRELVAVHLRGAFEVSLTGLAAAINEDPQVVAREIPALTRAGLLERGDDAQMLALSATGLRILRESLDRSPLVREPNALKSQSSTLDFAAAIERWDSVVEGSNLTESEKQRLQILGREFLLHPATPELLKRALSAADQIKVS